MEIQSVKTRFGIIGQSTALDRTLSTAIRVAPTDLTVLIQGESGVGKEVYSRIIHDLSKRRHEGFIAINCGAIPPGTINSELFGHEKGSFTGATGDRKGYFETVNGGTIFLDEIGEMPLDTQAYLLRVLETGEFIRVGSSKTLNTDVRVIAATNINLENQIRNGKFREDLYYRLNTVPIKIPSLHERQEDIIMLFRKFARDFSEKYRAGSIQLQDDAKELLKRYRWPGNIRELKNLVEQLSVMSDSKNLDAADVLEIAPHLGQRMLPANYLEPHPTGKMDERDIFYNYLVEMKKELNQMNAFIASLVASNNLEVPKVNAQQSNKIDFDKYPLDQISIYNVEDAIPVYNEPKNTSVTKPVVLDKYQIEGYHKAEVVEENLSLEDMEKSMIKRALKKYLGRRKEAAETLGISERTLYRKIKQYDLEE
jgi:DNA-binding NtrC family response regulator